MYNLSESHVSAHSAGTAGTTSRKCLCQFVVENEREAELLDPTLRCPACVQRSLKPYKERHAQALLDHAEAKKKCARELRNHNHHQRLSALQAESQQLRDRLTTMRKECSDMAVRVATQAIENDRHRENAGVGTDIELQQFHLARFEQELLQGSMAHAIEVATSQVRVLRFQWARKALAMHRLDIDLEDVKLTQLQRRRQQNQPNQVIQRRARGIGKIGGLPLPHAGPELYGVLPPRELQSALRLVASVTCTVARCLGIVLPHTILLTPNGPAGDIADTVSDGAVKQKAKDVDSNGSSRGNEKQQQHDQPVGSSSTASLYSLMDASYWKQSAKKVAKSALSRATGHVTERSVEPVTITPPSLDTSQVSRRLHHATAAVIAEDQNPMSSKYALSAEVMNQQDFAIALQLLQNNVIVLCIRAGVPVAKLWPAEAMLLNLHALDAYIQQQITVSF
jgi:hypothetical protein